MLSSKKRLFKLVLGLGNNSLSQIEELCGIYAPAGADIFDLSPDVNSLIAAKKGVSLAGLEPHDFKYCISFGVKGDKHIKKAEINNVKCNVCGRCAKVCPQEAIVLADETKPKVLTDRCIGCEKCACPNIDFFDFETDIAKTAVEFGKIDMPDLVELHISSFDKEQIFQAWDQILANFNCQKSICIDRSKYGDIELLELVRALISKNPQKTIIQADGVPMSGAAGALSTLQALAHAQLYQDLDAYIFISGGTNEETGRLAREFGLRYEGITIGSYARSAVKNLSREKAIEAAKKIVKSGIILEC